MIEAQVNPPEPEGLAEAEDFLADFVSELIRAGWQGSEFDPELWRDEWGEWCFELAGEEAWCVHSSARDLVTILAETLADEKPWHDNPAEVIDLCVYLATEWGEPYEKVRDNPAAYTGLWLQMKDQRYREERSRREWKETQAKRSAILRARNQGEQDARSKSQAR